MFADQTAEDLPALDAGGDIDGAGRAARRDLHHLDPRSREHGVERLGELPGPVADQEPRLAGTAWPPMQLA